MRGKQDNIKVMIAAGGTGGHIFPGVAIAEEIQKVHPNALVSFAGTSRGLEARLLPKLGWRLVLLRSSSIKDQRGIGKLFAWVRLPLSILQAFGILCKERPDLIISIGGYAAGPLSLVAWVMCIPFVIVEPNAIAGFTHRLLGRFARRAFVAFSETLAYFPSGRAVISGNPVRSEVLAVCSEGKDRSDKTTVFVFGGSQGAMRLNRSMVEALPVLAGICDRVRIVHQVGTKDDVDVIWRAYLDAHIDAKVFAFSESIWECYAKADLVIARAGATTVAELSALELPSILVPYPYAADDHQRANAKAMVHNGGAIMILDSECTGERLAQEIKRFIEDPKQLDKMHLALKNMGRPNAAKVIVEESWKLVRFDKFVKKAVSTF